MQTVPTQFRLFLFFVSGKCSKMIHPPETPEFKNGIILMIRMDKSTSQKRVLLFWFFGCFRCSIWLILLLLLNMKIENR